MRDDNTENAEKLRLRSLLDAARRHARKQGYDAGIIVGVIATLLSLGLIAAALAFIRHSGG